jgi:hypothetical protein
VKKRRHRILGGVTFECIEPGYWLSLDRMLCISHVLEGCAADAWELYRTQLATGEVRCVPKHLTWKAPKQLTWRTRIAFGMHDLVESNPLGGMASLAREVEKAADWSYNLAAGLYDAGRNCQFYRNAKLPEPTRERNDWVRRIVTRGERLKWQPRGG